MSGRCNGDTCVSRLVSTKDDRLGVYVHVTEEHASGTRLSQPLASHLPTTPSTSSSTTTCSSSTGSGTSLLSLVCYARQLLSSTTTIEQYPQASSTRTPKSSSSASTMLARLCGYIHLRYRGHRKLMSWSDSAPYVEERPSRDPSTYAPPK